MFFYKGDATVLPPCWKMFFFFFKFEPLVVNGVHAALQSAEGSSFFSTLLLLCVWIERVGETTVEKDNRLHIRENSKCRRREEDNPSIAEHSRRSWAGKAAGSETCRVLMSQVKAEKVHER